MDRTTAFKILDYIEKSEKYDSNDFDNLKVIITRWKTEHPEFEDEL